MKRSLIIVFGTEKFFSPKSENYRKYEKAVSRAERTGEILCFSSCSTAHQMAKEAMNDPKIRAIIIEPRARSTQENIKFSLPRFSWWEKITFCSTWYHLPRIIILYWLLRRPYMKQVKISLLPVWVWSFKSIFRAFLEIPKLFLDLLNIVIGLPKPEIFQLIKF
ncbi:MAG: ElyC/SanA/YdcF family protein [Patescibacteria group bacterium]